MTHAISREGLDFIKGFETFVPYVYDDLVPAQRVGGKLVYREWKPGMAVRGTLTIGYGHTDAARYDLGFKLRNVPTGFRLTDEQACQILAADLEEVEEAIDRQVKVPITQGMRDALRSFTFNLGEGALRTLVRRLNAGDYEATRRAFDLYVYAGGKRLDGLQRRRDGEQALWDSKTPEVPSEPVDHPAVADQPMPAPSGILTSTEGNTALGGAGLSGYQVSNEVSGAMAKVAAAGQGFSIEALLWALASSPTFWAAVFSLAAFAYWWVRRRHKLITQGV